MRAATAVDVLVMSREDFRSLVGQFEVFDEHFDKLLEKRLGASPHNRVAATLERSPLVSTM